MRSVLRDFSLLIIVPTFNSHTLLPRLVDSLLSQDFDRWRLVFVDGNSSEQHRAWLHNCCSLDPRFDWIIQSETQPGIYGAMNHGFNLAKPFEWVLFWGSDDWASSSTAFSDLYQFIASLSNSRPMPDLVISQCRYFNSSSLIPARSSIFSPSKVFNRHSFIRRLFLGHTPPHQSTLFSPLAIDFLNS